VTEYSFRLATTEDAAPVAALYLRSRLEGAPATPGEVERLVQTGHAFLLAEIDGTIAGAVRFRDEEGIGWFDLLASDRPWAGMQLVHAVERGCQDRGIRLLRTRCPDVRLCSDYFGWLGHLPIGRDTNAAGEPELVLERRLPLLTVREQRRSDAGAIGEITGHDPWVFEQGALPGWFVAADGENVVGVIQCADGGKGLARLSVPALLPGYRGRSLEAWMVQRAAEYAETNGFHTAEVDADPSLEPLKEALEDRYWVREGATWRRVFFTPKSEQDWED
jgi:ribosomal protein S18 acetylase RimI-like enzyme